MSGRVDFCVAAMAWSASRAAYAVAAGLGSLLVGLLARRAGVERIRPRHGPDRRQLAGANAQAAARGLEEASRGHVSCSLRSLRLTTLSLCGRFVSETAA